RLPMMFSAMLADISPFGLQSEKILTIWSAGGWWWTRHSPTGSGPEGSSPNELRYGSSCWPPTPLTRPRIFSRTEFPFPADTDRRVRAESRNGYKFDGRRRHNLRDGRPEDRLPGACAQISPEGFLRSDGRPGSHGED